MKSKITILFIAFVSTLSIAQTKVGTINSEYIINIMPQTKIVVEKTQDYGAKLDSSFSIKANEYQGKIDDFRKNEAEYGELMKKTLVNEITLLEEEMKKYQENGNKLMQLRQNELMRPLYKVLNDAIEIVSKENKYTQILTTTGNQFAYLDEKFDITQLVMDKLGIIAPEEIKE
jgi:outer membrane protein